MELVPTENNEVAAIKPAETTTRQLTLTLQVDSTGDIDTIIGNVKEFGKVTGVSYYENTWKSNNGGSPEGEYLY